MLLALAVVALALTAADSAGAYDHPPCEPTCDELDAAETSGGPGDLVGTAPVFLAMTVLLVAPVWRGDREVS